MTIEEVLVVDEGVIVAEFGNGLVSVAILQAAKTRVGEPLEGTPEDLVLNATDVDRDPPVEGLRPHDHKRLGR